MKPIKAIGFDYFGVIGGIFRVDEKILTLATSLKEKGYKIGVLSNISGLGEELMRKKKLTMFDTVLTSGDIGISKPNREAYEMLAKNLGVSLDEMLFIDDAHSYIDSMKSYGIRAVLYTQYENLLVQLKNFNITI